MKAILAGICSFVVFPLCVYAQSVDIVIEADTLAPSFYQGRHEPTAGSVMRAIAIVDGAQPETYTYRWDIDGRIYSDDAVVAFPAPFGSPFRIRVDVLDQNGSSVMFEERFVSLSESDVVFYTNNLLRGMSRNALEEQFILVGDEISIRAEPYFMSTDVFAGAYDLTWWVDGNEVAGTLGDSQTITLRRKEGGGTSRVEFALMNLRAFTQRVSDTFSVSF